MSRNDRSDSLSVRQDDDPRRDVKALQQEAEQELLRAEAAQSGGVEHQSERDRAGVPAARDENEDSERE